MMNDKRAQIKVFEELNLANKSQILRAIVSFMICRIILSESLNFAQNLNSAVESYQRLGCSFTCNLWRGLRVEWAVPNLGNFPQKTDPSHLMTRNGHGRVKVNSDVSRSCAIAVQKICQDGTTAGPTSREDPGHNLLTSFRNSHVSI